MSNDDEATVEDDAPRRLRLSWGGATHQGQIRPINQDALFADRGLFVVADGMGGHQAGEVASRITVRTLAGREHSSLEDLVDSVDAANTAVFDHASTGEEFKGMGTTLTAMAVVGDGRPPKLGLVNVGDSRVYRYRDDALEQLTDDHSYVAELVRRGQITEDQAETHPYRNMLTRAIGVADAVEADKWVLDPVADDVYLLCSDGLTNEVEEEEIAEILGDEHDPTAAARALIDRANRAGGRDNITVVIVNVELEPADPASPSADPEHVSPMETGVIASVASTAPDTAELVDLPAAVDALSEEDSVEVDGVEDPAETTSDDVAGASDDVAMSTAVIEPGVVAEALASIEEEHASPDAESTDPGPLDDDHDDDHDDEEIRPPAHPGDALAAFDLPQLDGDDTSLPWLVDPEAAGHDEATNTLDDAADGEPASDGSSPDDESGSAATEDRVPEDRVPEDRVPEEDSPDDEGDADRDGEATVVTTAATAPTTPEDDSAEASDDVGTEASTDDEVEPATSETTQPITPFRDPITASGPVDHFAPAVRGWKAPVAVTWRSLLFVTVVIAVIVAAGGLVAWYARSAYYVGYAGDEVVIYQGRPGGVLWFDPTLEEPTGIFRQELSESIAIEVEMLFEASTIDGARAFVEEIRPNAGVLSLDDDPPTTSP